MGTRQKGELVVNPETNTGLIVVFRIKEAPKYRERVPLDSESDDGLPQDANSDEEEYQEIVSRVRILCLWIDTVLANRRGRSECFGCIFTLGCSREEDSCRDNS